MDSLEKKLKEARTIAQKSRGEAIRFYESQLPRNVLEECRESSVTSGDYFGLLVKKYKEKVLLDGVIKKYKEKLRR